MNRNTVKTGNSCDDCFLLVVCRFSNEYKKAREGLKDASYISVDACRSGDGPSRMKYADNPNVHLSLECVYYQYVPKTLVEKPEIPVEANSTGEDIHGTKTYTAAFKCVCQKILGKGQVELHGEAKCDCGRTWKISSDKPIEFIEEQENK